MNDTCSDAAMAGYRPWFYAASVYNLLWGTINVLWPTLYFDLIGMPRPTYVAIWRVVGMFVLVYAPAYWWAGRYPWRHRHLILVGFLGKVLGPIGFIWSVSTHQLPIAFGWTILTNDLLWWPIFGVYMKQVVQECGGITNLLLGK